MRRWPLLRLPEASTVRRHTPDLGARDGIMVASLERFFENTQPPEGCEPAIVTCVIDGTDVKVQMSRSLNGVFSGDSNGDHTRSLHENEQQLLGSVRKKLNGSAVFERDAADLIQPMELARGKIGGTLLPLANKKPKLLELE